MRHAALIGRWFYAIAITAFGVLHLVYLDFVTRVVPWWPTSIPARPLWASLAGFVLVAPGLALLAGFRTSRTAAALGVGLGLSFLLLGLPLAISSDALSGAWTVAGKGLALTGGAWLLAWTTEDAPDAVGARGTSRIERLGRLGPWCFGAFLFLCGVQHFVHVAFVATLVPAWIPGPVFWARFAGVTLLAAAVGVVVPRLSGLAGALTALMIGTWVVILHIPRALDAATRGPNETTAVFEAIAMTGVALLVHATSERRRVGVPIAARSIPSTSPDHLVTSAIAERAGGPPDAVH